MRKLLGSMGSVSRVTIVSLALEGTLLGGNQYINSASMGPWEDFLLYEMLPAIEQRFGCGGIGRRGVFGKSSGGYGAVTHALRHSDIWSAAACHSGDMGFELCYLPDMPA